MAVLFIAGAATLAFPHLRTLWWLHLRPASPSSYAVPVAGVGTTDLEPNYGGPRQFGLHEGIDILSPAGTQVLAAADGVVVDDRPTTIGGNVVWILGSGRQLYYYAHLQRLAPGIRRGRFLAAGEPLGTVGNTGNAVGTPPHLHFAIHRVTSDFLPLRYEAIDPYPLLIAAGTTSTVEAAESRPRPTEIGPAGPLAILFHPEEALTLAPEAIAAHAEAASQRLSDLLGTLDMFLGIDADLDARMVQRFYELPGRLQNLARELRSLARGYPEVALRELPPAVRDRGTRVFHISRRLTLLLDAQSRCAYRDLPIFTSAIETLASELEAQPPADGLGTARVAYFVFDGHLPNVVPARGGWLVVVGSDLWSDGALRVSLLSTDERRVLAEFPTSRVAERDAAAIRVEPGFLTALGGRCLVLRVDRATEDSGALGRRRLEPSPGRELPLCVPVSWTSQHRVAGFVSYRVPRRHRILETDQILVSNDSCDQRRQVSRTLEWPLSREGRLADKGEWSLYESNRSSIDCQIDGNRIVCSGWLGPARCSRASGFGRGRIATEWHHLFSPTEEYSDDEEQRSAAISPGVDADADGARVCVEMRRDQASDETAMWFDVFAVNAHQQHVYFSAPRTIVKALARERYEIPPFQIEADFEPGLESGESQICVRFLPSECGY